MHAPVHAKYYIECEDNPQFNRIEIVVGFDTQLETLTKASQELAEEFKVNVKDMWLTHYKDTGLNDKLFGIAFVVGQREVPEGFTKLPENHSLIRKCV
jgi:hypothetical protein